MKTRAAVAERIEQLCKERGITINALSYSAGVANSTIKGIFYERSKNPGVVTIKKLCDGLDITLAQFFDTDTFNNLEQELQ
ncbi:MAG: helix-turn-helix transcriptional regulator [Oscillospiraceae bacterium]|nr:helix-turn-helix transcriptional regulator [Oscillospiraceae bacterium]